MIQHLGYLLSNLNSEAVDDVRNRQILLNMIKSSLMMLRDYNCPPPPLVRMARNVYLKDVWHGYIPNIPGFEPAINPMLWEWDDYSFKSE